MNKITLKPHNQETYENLTQMLKTENRVACVQPTGTGKSYIALRYIEEHSLKKILLLAPTDIILSQFRETVREIEDEVFEKEFFKNVKTAKYLDLGLEGFKDVFDVKWDTIIMDEFHRSGATTWNQFIDHLLKENPNAKIIGLSATPIRFLDNGRDMGLEFFKNNYACYITLKEALDREILPMPIYVCTDYRITTETSKYIREKYKYVHSKEQEQKIARRFLENGSGIHSILKKYLPNHQGKYIVFCQNSIQIKKMKPIMEKWLKPFNTTIHMYTTLSHDAEPDQPLLDFKYDQSEAIKLLFCVDRLNEGLHLSDLDGEFLLRGTDSPIIYFQQMGRVLTNSQKRRPVIFDLVNNYRSVRATIRRTVENEDREPIASFGQARDFYASYLGKDFDELIKFAYFNQARKFNDMVDDLDISYQDYHWNEGWMIFEEYYRKNHKTPSISEKFKDYPIGYWFDTQKKEFKKGTLSKKKQQKFENLGIFLPKKSNREIWLDHYLELQLYKNQRKTFPLKDCKEGIWFHTQLQYWREGKLAPWKQDKLKSLGYVFVDTSLNSKWNYKFNLTEEFIKIYKKEPKRRERYKGDNIGNWLSKQKILYNKGKLSKERQKKLESIGVVFEKDKKDEEKEK